MVQVKTHFGSILISSFKQLVTYKLIRWWIVELIFTETFDWQFNSWYLTKNKCDQHQACYSKNDMVDRFKHEEMIDLTENNSGGMILW